MMDDRLKGRQACMCAGGTNVHGWTHVGRRTRARGQPGTRARGRAGTRAGGHARTRAAGACAHVGGRAHARPPQQDNEIDSV